MALVFSAPLTADENDEISPVATAFLADSTALAFTANGGVFDVDDTNNWARWAADKLIPASYSGDVFCISFGLDVGGTVSGTGNDLQIFFLGNTGGAFARWDTLFLRVESGAISLYTKYFSFTSGVTTTEFVATLSASSTIKIKYDVDAATTEYFVNDASEAGPYSTGITPYQGDLFVGPYATSNSGGIETITISDLIANNCDTAPVNSYTLDVGNGSYVMSGHSVNLAYSNEPRREPRLRTWHYVPSSPPRTLIL